MSDRRSPSPNRRSISYFQPLTNTVEIQVLVNLKLLLPHQRQKRLLNEDPELGNCPVLHLSKPRDLYLRIDDIEIPWENIDHVNSTKRLQTDFRCSQGWQDVPPPRGT